MMSKLDLYRLTQPELLSEHELCQLLTNSCIEIKDFEKFSKAELIEMYKRVAMPLPQRQQEDRKSKEDNKHNVNRDFESEEWDENITLKNSNLNESDNTSSTNLCEKRKKIHQDNLTDSLTSSTIEPKSVSKKIRLSTPPKIKTDCNEIIEHKTNEKNEDSALTPTRKRQKITWP